MQRLLRNRSALVAVAILGFLAFVAIFADVLAPQDPNAQTLARRLEQPSTDHWLGTDNFGRDILSRLIAGTQVTLLASLLGLGVAVVLGIPVGLLAGLSGKWVDAVLSRVGDGVLAFPPLVLAMSIIGIAGPGLRNAMVAVGIILAPRFFRVARAAARSTYQELYIEALRAEGTSRARIMWRHLLPNAAGPLLAQTSFALGTIVSAEASLSFLGLGVELPQASWGGMIKEASEAIRISTWSLVPPTVAVVTFLVASFMLGDAVRDAIGRNMGDSR